LVPRSNKKGRPKKFKSSIKGRSLVRRRPSRTVGKSILIVCEDSKSSPAYFRKYRKKLSLRSVNVEVCGEECGSAPKSVVDFAKVKKLEVETSTVRDEYDVIFCVVDVDDHPSLGDAVQTARDNSLNLIISNPCFEYWYILHFERTGSSFSNRQQLYRKLESWLGHKYEKSGCDFFEIVYERTKTAIDNSKEILRSQWHNEEDLRQCDPSTHVHRVVECMKDIAQLARQ
jgi:hypothetical protein